MKSMLRTLLARFDATETASKKVNKRMLALTTAGLSLVSGVALAGQPTITRSPVDATFVHDVCGFITSTHLTGTMIDISYTDRQGVFRQFVAFPQGTAVMTGPTGKSITVKVSGPYTITTNPDGSGKYVANGVQAWTLDPESLVTDTIIWGWFYTKGRIEFLFNAPDEAPSVVTRTGTKIALCPKLQ